MSYTEKPNKFHKLRDKILRRQNPVKDRHQTNTGNAAESSQQTSSNAVNSASTLDEFQEVTLPRSSPSTLVGNGKNPANIASESASIHKVLWETAYNNLKSDRNKKEYVTTYEELLSTNLLNGQGLGEEQMKEIIALGLKKIEKYKEAIDHSEGKLEIAKAIKSILDIPLSNIPQTFLPWAIISSSVDVSAFQDP